MVDECPKRTGLRGRGHEREKGKGKGGARQFVHVNDSITILASRMMMIQRATAYCVIGFENTYCTLEMDLLKTITKTFT